MSLLLELRFSGQPLATATGFIVVSPQGKPVLVTNRHNLTGRRQDTGELIDKKYAAVPNEVVINHNRKGQIGAWIKVVEPILDDDGNPLWIEHAHLGATADCVALPLTNLADVELYPYELHSGQQMNVGIASVVSVIGFPFGLTQAGGMAIWATGFVASEPELIEPSMLIDCRSRKGQSGSAVIAYRGDGSYGIGNGITLGGAPAWRLMGIYSGRINDQSDLGIVWKPGVIEDILKTVDKAAAHNGPLPPNHLG